RIDLGRIERQRLIPSRRLSHPYCQINYRVLKQLAGIAALTEDIALSIQPSIVCLGRNHLAAGGSVLALSSKSGHHVSVYLWMASGCYLLHVGSGASFMGALLDGLRVCDLMCQ